MKTNLVLTIAVQLAIFGCRPKVSGDLIFSNVNVIDVIEGVTIENQDVVIDGNQINTIIPHGQAKLYSDQLIEGDGKFLIPGLWDMHMHLRARKLEKEQYKDELAEENKDLLSLHVVNGITSVHEMGGDLTDLLLEWRGSIRSGELLGPNLYLTGPKIEGKDPIFAGSYSVETESDIDSIISLLMGWKVDGIKIMDGSFEPEALFEVIKACKQAGLKSYAHLFIATSPLEASNSHLSGLAHMINLVPAAALQYDLSLREMRAKQINNPGHPAYTTYLNSLYDRINDGILREIIQTYADNETALISTYNVVRSQSTTRAKHIQTLKYVGPGIRKSVLDRFERTKRMPSVALHLIERNFDFNNKVLQLLPESNAKLLIGTDSGFGNLAPGLSYHYELDAMGSQGVRPSYLLKAATYNAAEFMGKHDLEGSVTIGKIADLVLLNKNPLQSIRNTQAINGVVRNGKFLDRNMLDQILQSLANKYEAN